MASAFGHALVAASFGQTFHRSIRSWGFLLLGMACSILPDADVIGFKFGIAYGDFWGHRGFTHSFLFAALLAICIVIVFYRSSLTRWAGLGYFVYFFMCTASHAVLDAMTTGGLGVAFFSPWDNTRYFFPWRPIKVSPIGVKNFFSEWGKTVLLSEAVWIGVPCVAYSAITVIIRRIGKL